MLLAESSENVQIAGLFFSFLGTVFTGVMAYFMARLNKKTGETSVKMDQVAARAEQVKETLAENTTKTEIKLEELTQATDNKLEKLATVAASTHTLVNNNMAIQLKDNADLKRWKANHTGDEGHIREAEAAEKVYQEHQAKQAKVDAAKTV